jgi:actin-like ATPase involved in cell morphogenesis
MGYSLGIDLGTTYSGAAVAVSDRLEIFQLGDHSATIPSVVLLRADGEVLTGEAADHRALSEPTRTAREFKRRLGDPVPIILGGTPYGAESLMGHLLRSIVDKVRRQMGAAPDAIAVAHPASYGPYKLDLLQQAVRQAEIGQPTFITEPEAAAVHYASQERIPTGEVIAVYDFGGGTFDATVLRKTEDRFDQLGMPEGLERLGGVDFDEAIMAHVDGALGGALKDLDRSNPNTHAAVSRLRDECRRAKEALSSDADATIPVFLPGVQTEVRLTREEFESMIRPRVRETIAALERAVRSAGLTFADVGRVLLVGGTSRIPVIGEMVQQATGRPIAVDAHPKHTIALGAARRAMGSSLAAPVPTALAPLAASAAVAATPPADGSDEVSAPSRESRSDVPASAEPVAIARDTSPPPASVAPAQRVATAAPVPAEARGNASDAAAPSAAVAPAAAAAAARPDTASGPSRSRPTGEAAQPDEARRRRFALAAAGGLGLVAVLVIGGAATLNLAGAPSDSPAVIAATGSPAPTASATPHTTVTPGAGVVDPGPSAATPSLSAPPPRQSPSPTATVAPTSPPAQRTATITGVTLSGGRYVVNYETTGFVPGLPGRHVHFFFDTVPPDQAGIPGRGPWFVYGGPNPFTGYSPSDRPASAEQMCVLVARPDHSVIQGTGNCHDLPN